MKTSKYYITTPIYYPNAKPHLGTLYTTLIADFLARWNKVLGKEVFFVTGLDEHGQKIEEAAALSNITPQNFVDKKALDFIDCWKKYEFNYDFFIRTTSQKHCDSVINLFEKLIANNFIYKANYSGYYCVSEEMFVTLQMTDTPEVCPSCNKQTTVVDEENYFFKLSLFQDKLLKFYSENPEFITPFSRMNEVISFVKGGLKDLSITRRNVKWGIPFPGDPKHTIYVWGDALTNYLSSVGFGSTKKEEEENFKKWWPADVHVLGKDIVKFHAVYWPAILMAANLLPPKKLLVHGYILVDNKKMSKSLGNVIDPVELANNFGSEAVRYCLIKNLSITQDGSFSFSDLQACYNSDLANNFGNLVNRLFTLAKKNNFEKIDPVFTKDEDSEKLLQLCHFSRKTFSAFVKNGFLHQAIGVAMELCSAINTFVHKKEPWKIKNDKKEFLYEIIATSFQALSQVSVFLWPVIPNKIETLFFYLGLENKKIFSFFQDLGNWQQFMNLNFNIKPLFPRLEIPGEKEPVNAQITKKSESTTTQTIPDASFEDFLKVKLAVGEIVNAVNVSGSDKLLQLTVNFGCLGIRQVVSGIAKEYAPNSLLGKKAIFVINLVKRKIMGIESEAMILIAKDAKVFTMVSPLDLSIEPGTILG